MTAVSPAGQPTHAPEPGGEGQHAREGGSGAQNRAESNPRIGLDDDGTLDDFYATGISSVHFEAIDQAAWYATITLADGRIWQLNFGAKNDRAHGYAMEERVR